MSTFTVGQRVESGYGTNAWISGDRFGTVEKIGSKYVHVRMDRFGRLLRFTITSASMGSLRVEA